MPSQNCGVGSCRPRRKIARLAVLFRDGQEGARTERYVGNVRVGLQIGPDLIHDPRDVEPDPAIVLA